MPGVIGLEEGQAQDGKDIQLQHQEEGDEADGREPVQQSLDDDLI